MTSLHCPMCNTEVMEHQAGVCLDRAVYAALGFKVCPVSNESPDWAIPGPSHKPETWKDEHERHYFLGVSNDEREALRLMQKVWEMDPSAAILSDEIWLQRQHEIIDGPTFPVRVCRAALWLAGHLPQKDES